MWLGVDATTLTMIWTISCPDRFHGAALALSHPLLQVDLEPDAATAAAMQQQLEQFDAQVYQHPEFSDRSNLTGDLLGHAGLDQLHRMDVFQWLNGQLAEHVSAYLRSLLGPEHGLMAHIQKAWPVVCARNGGSAQPPQRPVECGVLRVDGSGQRERGAGI